MSVCNTLKEKANLGQCVVVIDVFRSSNTIIELLCNGASRVVPVEDIQVAEELKESNPSWLFFGERRGIRLPGCDGDNSPVQNDIDVDGKIVILTTSGGTRCISACTDEQDVFIGSFSNATALTEALHTYDRSQVSFWAVGVNGEVSAEEDVLCAQFLDNYLHGHSLDFPETRRKLLEVEGAARLRQLGQLKDLDYCTTLDIRKSVPRRKCLNKHLWCFEL